MPMLAVRRIFTWVLVSLGTFMSAGFAASIPDRTMEGWHWKLAGAGPAKSSNAYEVEARRGEQLLLWDDGKNAQVAD
jgi:hypothetical protein